MIWTEKDALMQKSLKCFITFSHPNLALLCKLILLWSGKVLSLTYCTLHSLQKINKSHSGYDMYCFLLDLNLYSVIYLLSLHLKLVSAIYFFTKWQPYKNCEKCFYFIKKALFVLEIFKYLYFYLPLFFFLSKIALEDEWR